MTNQAIATRKNKIMRALEALQPELVHMSDFIFDHPEIGFQEVQAAQLLSGFLQGKGFQLEMGYGGLPTAFRAIHQNGHGGPRIGLLCEYDAIENLGHACAHHLQGPCIAGAAVALKESVQDFPYTLEVIGTPAEEIGGGGKNIMLEHGAFKELDVALMMHGGDATQADVRSMAISEFLVTFHGVSAHSAISPEQGRSALEALMLMFNGISFLRGHVREDTRIHGIIVNGGQAVNVIPEKATARIEVRSYDRPYLDQLIGRVLHIVEGAALMTDTRSEVERVVDIHNKIPVITLNDLMMNNARLAGAGEIMPPREKTGSTDFASVMYFVPGSCIRVPFVAPGVKAHSQTYLDRGKSGEAHGALVLGAKILALTALDLIADQGVLDTLQQEFRRKKAEGVAL